MRRVLKSLIPILLLTGCGSDIDVWQAAINGNEASVKKYIESGGNINAQNEFGATPLHIAANSGNLAIAKLLIAQEADLNLLYEESQTPLHLAAGGGHGRIIKLLLEGGADVNFASPEGITPLHVAAFNNQRYAVKRLIAAGAKVDAESTKDNVTPLLGAASKGFTDTIEVLLDNTDQSDLQGNYGSSVLHVALHQGHSETAMLLIERNIATHLACESCGQSSLATAASEGLSDIVQILIDTGADIHTKWSDGQTALHIATENGHIEVAKLLIENGADVNALYGSKWTPLHVAAENDRGGIAELLIENGALINAKDRGGQTPLHRSVSSARVGIYKLYDTLVAKGASEKIWDNSGNTAKELKQEHQLESGLGVDLDGDGFDEHDELLTGHSDVDPDDKPTQAEVVKALAARDKLNEDWSEWIAHKKAGKVDGWNYSGADFKNNSPPDDENFFFAEPFSGFLYTQKNGEEPVFLNPEIKKRFEEVKPLLLPEENSQSNEAIADWAKFAEQLRERSRTNSETKKHFPANGSDDEVLMAYFEQFEGVLNNLREAARRKQQHFPAAYENGYTTELPHLQVINWYTKLLQQSTAFKQHQNNPEEAMENINLLFRLYDSIGQSMVEHMAKQSIGNTIVVLFESGFDSNKWRDADLSKWQRHLETDRRPYEALEHTLIFERAMSIYSLEGTARGQGKFMFEDSMHQSIPLLPKKFIEKELISLDSQMRQLIELCRHARETGILDHDKLAKLSDKTEKGIIATAIFPGLKKALENEEKLTAQFDTLTKGLAKR